MKKIIKQKILKEFSKLIALTAERETDSACFLFCYQPKVPDELKNGRNH